MGGLSALHIYFSSRNMTTYEHFRHRDSANPYNLGPLRNCGEVFCTRIPTMAEERALAGHVPKPGARGVRSSASDAMRGAAEQLARKRLVALVCGVL